MNHQVVRLSVVITIINLSLEIAFCPNKCAHNVDCYFTIWNYRLELHL